MSATGSSSRCGRCWSRRRGAGCSIDCGAGDKMAAKQVDIYALDRTRTLDHALADAGLTSDVIDFALATHLHFDHFGGATTRGRAARCVRASPRRAI